jgi:p-aminobenzoyl-glutamate transporter AbgT
LILIGSITAVASGEHSSPSYTVDELVSFYSRDGFIAYAICVVTALLSMYCAIKHIEPKKLALQDAIEEFEAAREAQDAQAMQV